MPAAVFPPTPRPPAGSSAAYALNRCPPESRAALAGLWALHAQLRGIVALSSPDAAQAKLQWWQMQIARLPGGGAEHPLLREHGSAWLQRGVDPAWLQGAAEGVALDLRQNRWLDRAALLRYAQRSGGEIVRASAQLLGLDAPAQLQAALALGAGLRLVQTLRALGRDLAQSRVYLPLDVLQANGLRANDLLAPGAEVSAALRSVLQAQAALAREQLRIGREVATNAPTRRAAPLLSLAATSAALLDEIEASGFDVLRQHIALTPLRKLWLSRTARWRQRS